MHHVRKIRFALPLLLIVMALACGDVDDDSDEAAVVVDPGARPDSIYLTFDTVNGEAKDSGTRIPFKVPQTSLPPKGVW